MTIKILLVDDEIEYLEWLVDYIERYDGVCSFAEDIATAVDISTSDTFDFFIVDLNIPLGDSIHGQGSPDYSKYQNYYGFYLIRKLRSLGVAGNKIVAYSVHRNAIISNAIDQLGCLYIAKGRPRELKELLNSKVLKVSL